jgi:nanoRNase/pAp phosphatase (c-di-AMP/oligoRNAs hydrolase)
VYAVSIPGGDDDSHTYCLCVNTTQQQYDIRSRLGNELAKRNEVNGIAAVCYPTATHWCISLRSIGEGDVSDITRISVRFRGGGHRNASGFSLPNSDGSGKKMWDEWKI